MNIKVMVTTLVIILIVHVILQKMSDIQNENFKLQETINNTTKITPKSKQLPIEDVIIEDIEDNIDKTTDMRDDLLKFVESSSFYEPVKSFGHNKILPQETTYSNEPGFLNISKDNELKEDIEKSDTIVYTKDKPHRDNVTLKNSKYDKMSNSRVYYSTTANDKHRTIKRDSWKYDKDTISSGNIPIEGSLFAYDQNECNFAAI